MSTDQASKTYAAEVIQYLRPDGRQVPVTTRLPVDTHDAYQAMLAAGCRLEAEVLMTSQVSVTIFDVKSEEDLDCRVVENGPAVQEAQSSMLRARPWENRATIKAEGES